MKKKVIALALTACMVPVGSGVDVMAAKGDSGDKITLNWQSYDSYDKYQKVVEAFEKENPDIEINFEEVSDYATKILTEATAGDLPDLINCNTGTTQILANAGALQKFDVDALKADTEYKLMISGMLQKTIVHMMVTGIHFHWTEEIMDGFTTSICLTSVELKFRKMDLHGMSLQMHVKH